MAPGPGVHQGSHGPLPEDERIAVRAGETRDRIREEGRQDFGLIDGIIYETARAVDAILVTEGPHFRGVRLSSDRQGQGSSRALARYPHLETPPRRLVGQRDDAQDDARCERARHLLLPALLQASPPRRSPVERDLVRPNEDRQRTPSCGAPARSLGVGSRDGAGSEC